MSKNLNHARDPFSPNERKWISKPPPPIVSKHNEQTLEICTHARATPTGCFSYMRKKVLKKKKKQKKTEKSVKNWNNAGGGQMQERGLLIFWPFPALLSLDSILTTPPRLSPNNCVLSLSPNLYLISVSFRVCF